MLTANATAIPLPVTTKTCTACNIEKPLSEFSPARRYKFGVRSHCKHCENMRKRKIASELSSEQIERKSLGNVRSGMIARCYKPGSVGYKYYGARGITVCQRWMDSTDSFVNDMGPRPTGYQLDRIDNDGNYEPENCHWATRAENMQNQRMRRTNKTGVTGVLLTKDGLYRATLMRNGIKRDKEFKQRWDAISYRMSMENRYRETGAL